MKKNILCYNAECLHRLWVSFIPELIYYKQRETGRYTATVYTVECY